jgi:two-component system chemotaxis response regulator CheB
MNERIKVLIVDDSALVRQVLTAILDAQPDIKVVAACMDPLFARDKIKQLNPDVITLDVEMPRMDGLTFLDKLMRLHPVPVVMISSLTEAGVETTLKALELGAVDYVAKPKINIGQRLMEDYAEEVVSKVRIAARSKVSARRVSAETTLQNLPSLGFRTTEAVIAIGASTGGTEAIKQVLMQLPADAPGIVIAQHIPEAFAGPFAERINRSTRVCVALAKDGQQILPGHAYIAPGDQHLAVVRNGARYVCRLLQTEPVNRHRPSVEVLFDSVAKNVGKNAIAVMLTGMGKDGAQAMLRVRQAGGRTLAQDELSSVVWGMPGECVKIDAAEQQASLHQIPGKLLQMVLQHKKAS